MVVGAKVDQNYRLLVTTSGQITNISGQSVITSISGNTVVTSISGNIVKISGQCIVTDSGSVTTVSGNVVFITNLSGQNLSVSISGVTVSLSGATLVTTVSGNPISIIPPTLIRTGGTLAVTDASGGVALSSGEIVSVVLKAMITNTGDIYVGGAAPNEPYSGFGYVLSQGEPVAIDIDNFNAVFVVAVVSGDQVSFMGND